MKELWYKNAIIYGLDVETFQDSNGDGAGDFRGLTSRLPYLKRLGITCLWLLPFYPTPNRDNGYDITDYYSIDPRLGTFDDFRTFMQEAKKAGIRVVIDLVIQHTSDEHPWFKAAEASENSPYRKYYFWSKNHPPKLKKARVSFLGEEKKDVWTWDPVAQAYYHHWFYHFQPDLNTDQKEVREEIFRIARFWMSFGISGFRVDAAGLLYNRIGIPGHVTRNPGRFLKRLRQVISSINPEAVLVGEADVPFKYLNQYWGKGDRMHMMFNFILNGFMGLAIAKEEYLPLGHTLKKLSSLPANVSWINFVRNLDEYNLQRIGKKNMDLVRKKLKVTDKMWIYKRGIRRRIAPLIRNREKLQMIWSLVFALPGGIFFPYGDEIGMGDDQSLPFRLPVRTPMQWNSGKNGGFSSAPKSKLFLPVINRGAFGFRKVNVKNEEKDKDSWLNYFKALIRFRRKFDTVRSGKFSIIPCGHKEVLVLQYRQARKSLIVIHNLSHKYISFILPEIDGLRNAFKRRAEKIGDRIELDRYGFLWTYRP